MTADPAAPELADIRDFLAGHHPFDLLPPGELDTLTRQLTIRYLKKGAILMEPGERIGHLSIVRSGALETHDPEGALLAHAGEGDAAGVRALLRGGLAVNRIAAIEDTLIYQLPAAAFDRLREAHASFAYFFAPQGGERLRGAMAAAGVGDQVGLTTRRVADLVRREPVLAPPDMTVAEAAARMRREGISSLLIAEEGRLTGILTDRDLRNRVLAEGRAGDTAVADVMTPRPLTVPATAFLFEALMLLTRHGIHHMPVVRGDVPVGVLTSTDLLRTQTRSVVYVASDIHKRDSAEGISKALAPLPSVVLDLVEAGAGAYAIGHAVTAVADSATQRLIQLAEAELGPPPVPYAWMALGSQGRNEQTARSDQDNALLIADDFDPDVHGPWFRAMAERVCDGLNTAGFVWCPGGIMAKTDRWRQTLSEWKRTFAGWIDRPDPEALMYASVFFDLRAVHGRAELLEDLQAEVLRRAQGSRLFLGHLTGNALTHQPPLGLFRNLVLIGSGEHRKTLDLKHTGIVPVVDLARIYALDAGLAAVNTRDRLAAARDAGKISEGGARDLIDALDFLSLIRLRHQARQIRDGRPADNFLPPDELSGFERGHLKDAFSVIKAMQAAAVAAYRGGRG